MVVSITGYPFYYSAPHGAKAVKIPERDSKDGFGWFISSIDAQVLGPQLVYCDLTPEGKTASVLLNDTKFPDKLWVSRCFHWLNKMPEKIFYGAGPIMGAGVIKFGSGLFICNFIWSLDLGTSPSKYSDEFLAKMSFVFIRDTVERISFEGLEEPRLKIMQKIASSLSSELSKSSKRPRNEKQLQNEIKRILDLRYEELNFRQEKDCFGYSMKSYKPDFVSTNLNAVVEGKICTKNRKPTTLVREINDYIVAFSTKYEHLLFVVYDGYRKIKNPQEFVQDFRKYNPNVQVVIVKPN